METTTKAQAWRYDDPGGEVPCLNLSTYCLQSEVFKPDLLTRPGREEVVATEKPFTEGGQGFAFTLKWKWLILANIIDFYRPHVLHNAVFSLCLCTHCRYGCMAAWRLMFSHCLMEQLQPTGLWFLRTSSGQGKWCSGQGEFLLIFIYPPPGILSLWADSLFLLSAQVAACRKPTWPSSCLPLQALPFSSPILTAPSSGLFLQGRSFKLSTTRVFIPDRGLSSHHQLISFILSFRKIWIQRLEFCDLDWIL